MGFKEKLADILHINREVKVVTPIDQELASKDSQIKALLRDNQNKSGEISRMKAEDRKDENAKTDEEDKQKKNNEIQEKQNIIDSEKFEDALSLKSLFDYMNKHPSFKIDIMDRDMSIKFSEFGDLVFFKDGELGILDKNREILSKGKKLNHIFFKPGGLKGQINRKLIRLPCDRDFRGLPDIEEIEMPECTFDPVSGKIKLARFSHKPLGELIKSREETINNLSVILQEKEESIAMLVKSNREKTRQAQILESKNKTSEVEMSVMTNRYKSMHKKFRNLETKLSQSQSMRTLAENIKQKYKESLDELANFVSEKLAKTDGEVFMDKVKDMVDWIDDKIPKPQPQPQTTKPNPERS